MNTPALPLKGAFDLRSAKPLLNDYFVSEELVENLSTRFLLNKTMAKGPALVLQVACASSSSGFARGSQGATRPSISRGVEKISYEIPFLRIIVCRSPE